MDAIVLLLPRTDKLQLLPLLYRSLIKSNIVSEMLTLVLWYIFIHLLSKKRNRIHKSIKERHHLTRLLDVDNFGSRSTYCLSGTLIQATGPGTLDL